MLGTEFYFDNVDWKSLQMVYGWAAFQYQAWARTTLTVSSFMTISLQISNVLEFWIDSNHYFGGDFYDYNRAPAIVTLSPGVHQIDIRLIRDVRAMGGTYPPTIKSRMQVGWNLNHLTVVDHGRVLTADVIDGMLASRFASVSLQNTGTRGWKVMSIISESVCLGLYVILSGLTPTELSPCQLFGRLYTASPP